MRLLRHAQYFLHFIQMFVTVTIVIALMFLFNKQNHKIRIAWAKMQLKLLGIKLDIKGKIDPNADLFILNHQSLLDIIVIESISPRDIAWVAKKEIAQLPFFGLILRLPKMIIVDRENKAGLAKLLKETKIKKEKDHRPVAIFPEGTRGKGDRLLKFKSGAKIIAQKHKMKVQPVVLVRTREILDSKSLQAKPGTVKIEFLPTVEATKESTWFEDSEKLMGETFKHHRVI